LQSDRLNASYRQDWMLARYSLALLLSELGAATEARRSAVQAHEAAKELMTMDPENRDWRTWSIKINRSFPALKEQ